jgi:hypothetical protein
MKRPANGGSSDTGTNVLTTIPVALPSTSAHTATTPLGQPAKIDRRSCISKDVVVIATRASGYEHDGVWQSPREFLPRSSVLAFGAERCIHEFGEELRLLPRDRFAYAGAAKLTTAAMDAAAATARVVGFIESPDVPL